MQQGITHPSRKPVPRRIRVGRWLVFCAVLPLAALVAAPAAGQSRIKDIVDFEGVRENLLVGYGLVVGLNGTGDTLNSAVFTKESLIGMLERLGVNARETKLKTNNVAAVMVTATLPAFARQGTRIDVSVSALGDAKNLLGGTLLVTPLLGADGEIYAVGQGNLQVAGYSAQGAAESVIKGVPTSGRIPNGAIVEREIPFALASMKQVRLALRNPDFTTAGRIAGHVYPDGGVLIPDRAVSYHHPPVPCGVSLSDARVHT